MPLGGSDSLNIQNQPVQNGSVEGVGRDYSAYFRADRWWSDRESMIAWAYAATRTNHTVLKVLNSSDNSNKVYLVCERHFVVGDEDDRTTKSLDMGSKESGCPFLLHGWEERRNVWRLEVKCGIHNHNFPPIISSMQRLWDMLTERKYMFGYRISDGIMQDLVFAHPESLRLWEKFPYVMIMATNYQTNRCNFPLLEIVGQTCTETTFHLAFAFITTEDEDTYTWVLRHVERWCLCRPKVILTPTNLDLFKAVTNVYPDVHHMLCMGHVCEHIKDKAYKCTMSIIEQNEFLQKSIMLFESRSSEEFKTRHHDMTVHWGDKWGLMDYLNKTWISQKEKVVLFLTDQHLHLGNRTTYRVSVAHAGLMQYLGSSTGQLDTCFEHIGRMFEDQIRQVRGSLEQSRFTTPAKISSLSIFRLLLERVSTNCLERLYQLYVEACKGGFSPECKNCYVRSSFGLPCVHEVARIVKENRVFVEEDVHLFWRQVQWNGQRLEKQLQKVDTHRTRTNHQGSMTINDPSLDTPKGRPKKNSTTRERSDFEYTCNEGHKAQKEMNKKSSIGQKCTRVTPGDQSATPIDCENENIKGRQHTDAQLLELGVGGYNFGHGNFESFMIPYDQHITNVLSDGNCGFRALAVLLGRSENAWIDIRSSMLMETTVYPERYTPLLRGETISVFMKRLHWFDQGVTALEAHWMDMPVCGALFATIYQCTVVYLDWFGAHTILPLVRQIPAPGSPPPNTILVLCRLRSQQHFVAVHMSNGHPMPPILKEWYSLHDQSVAGMDAQYASRIQEFRDLRRMYGRPAT